MEFSISGNNIGEPYTINFSYGAPYYHDKTDLSEDGLNDLVYNTLTQMAYFMHPDATAACGELNNGGDWDGYYAVAMNGDWGDCWM